MTDFNMREVNLDAINSLTKYPSIDTYHAINPHDGVLLEGAVMPFEDTVWATEKVDGTNARLIFLPDGNYLIGSRTELLYASGDLLHSGSHGIAETLRPYAERIQACTMGSPPDCAFVVYGEVYGHKQLPAAKHYSSDGTTAFRYFDLMKVQELSDKVTWDPEKIAGWRQRGGQSYFDVEDLHMTWLRHIITPVPRLFRCDAAELPKTIEETRDFLGLCAPKTMAAIGESPAGQAEGIVIRDHSRDRIAKLRFQDYDRALRMRRLEENQGAKK